MGKRPAIWPAAHVALIGLGAFVVGRIVEAIWPITDLRINIPAALVIYGLAYFAWRMMQRKEDLPTKYYRGLLKGRRKRPNRKL